MSFVICGPSECLMYRVKMGDYTYMVQLFGEEHIQDKYDPCTDGIHVINYIEQLLDTKQNIHLFLEAIYDHEYKYKFKDTERTDYDPTKSVLYNTVTFFTKHKGAFRRKNGLVHYTDIRPSSILLQNRIWDPSEFLVNSNLNDLVDNMFELFVYSDNFFGTLSTLERRIKWSRKKHLFKNVIIYKSKTIHIIRKQILKLHSTVRKPFLDFIEHLKNYWKVNGNTRFGYDTTINPVDRIGFISIILGGVFVDIYMIARMLRVERNSNHKEIIGMFGSAHLAETHLQFCKFMNKYVEVLYQSESLQHDGVYAIADRDKRIYIDMELVSHIMDPMKGVTDTIYRSYREAKQHGIGSKYMQGHKV